MRLETKSKINHLLPRVMVCLSLLCIGLIMTGCSTYGLHEQQLVDEEKNSDQEREHEQESSAEDQAEVPVSQPIEALAKDLESAQLQPDLSDRSTDAQSAEKKTSETSFPITAEPKDDKSEAEMSLSEPSPASTEKKKDSTGSAEQIVPQNNAAQDSQKVSETASVDDYSLPVDAPPESVLESASSGSPSDASELSESAHKPSDGSKPRDKFQETEREEATGKTAYSGKTNSEPAVLPPSAELNDPASKERASDLQTRLEDLKNAGAAQVLDQKDLARLADERQEVDEAQQTAQKPKQQGSSSEQNEKKESGDISKASKDVVVKGDVLIEKGVSNDKEGELDREYFELNEIGQSVSGLKTNDERNKAKGFGTVERAMPVSGGDVVVEGNVVVEGDVRVKEAGTSTLIYNGRDSSLTAQQPSRNIRWNLQKPPSREPNIAE